jgi:hypothetical protein
MGSLVPDLSSALMKKGTAAAAAVVVRKLRRVVDWIMWVTPDGLSVIGYYTPNLLE